MLEQLADGRLFLIDFAAGHGAGTIAMLALVAELRTNKLIPKLPINIHVHGVDYSNHALLLFQEMLDRLDIWLLSNGINVKLTSHSCDLRIVGEVDEVLELLFDEAESVGANRFFLSVFAVSGVGKDCFEQIAESVRHTAARLANKKRKSTGLWVEPCTKPWYSQLASTIALTFKKIQFQIIKTKEFFQIKTSAHVPPKLHRTFVWFSPTKGKEVEGHAEVFSFWHK